MGACTIALTGARAPRTGVKSASSTTSTFMLGTITPSSSYASGGDTLDFGTSFGLIGNRGSSTTAEPTAIFVQPSAGYVPEYDAANKKIKVYRQSAATSALTEATGVNLSAVTFNCLIFF
jgi:hypothetical protein